MIQDIIGILPPKEFTLGKRYSFLQDIKNAGSYSDTKDARGSEFKVGAQDVYGALMIRNLNVSEVPAIQLPDEVIPHTLWGTIEDIITACQSPSNPNPHCYISLKYMYLEADITIKDDIVPAGVRLADGALTFNDWGANTENFTPTVATSLDGTKIVYAIHLVNSGQGLILMDEIKSWIEFANVSNKNISLLTHFEYQNLVQSSTYNSEII